MTRARIPTRPKAVLALALAMAGCIDAPAGVEPVAAVTLSPGAPAPLAALGATLTLTATARAAAGNPIEGVAFTWLSDDPLVATVLDGSVTAVGNGTATITASAEGVTGTATVTVQQAVSRLGVRPIADVTVRTAMPAVVVELQDANGNVVTDATEEVTIAIGDNPGNLILHTSGIGMNDRFIELVDHVTPVVLTPELSNNEAMGEVLGLAYDDATGTMYMTMRTDSLFTIDLTTGAVSAIGATGAADRVKGLAFVATMGALLGGQRDSDEMIAIDPASGDTTLVGRIVIADDSITGFTGLDEDPTTGVIWASVKLRDNPTNKDRELVTIDLGTRTATRIGTMTEGAVAGITFLADGSLLAVTGGGGGNPETLYGVDTTDGAMDLILPLGNGGDGESIEAIPGRMSGTLTMAASAGVATFSDLTIDASGIGFTLVASVRGLADARSAPFDVKQ